MLLINVSITHCVALSFAIITESFRLFRIDWNGLKMINNLNMLCKFLIENNDKEKDDFICKNILT